MVVITTNNSREALNGQGVFFVRNTTKAVTPTTLYADVTYGLISPKLLPSLTALVKHVLMPALKAQDQWGVLNKEQDPSIKSFMETLEKFVVDIDAALLNLNESIKLQPCTADLTAYKQPSDYHNATHHPDLVSSLEQLVSEWCKQVEKVLAESEQMRKEADDVGPSAELAHWKARLIKFNSIDDQLKSDTCQTVIGILIAAKSKTIIKTWRDLENRVADAANESKVLFLYSL